VELIRRLDQLLNMLTLSLLPLLADLSSTLDQMLNPFTDEEFADMNVTEYRDAAHEILMRSSDHTGDSQGLVRSLAANLARELIYIFLPLHLPLPPNDCSKLVKVALMLKAAQDLIKILHLFYHHSLRILYSRH